MLGFLIMPAHTLPHNRKITYIYFLAAIFFLLAIFNQDIKM
jgi:hypothetical protein